MALVAALLGAAAAYAVVVSLSGPGGAGAAAKRSAWLGVDLASSPLLAGGFQSGFGGFPFAAGALVTGVAPRGPAAQAGIEPGDVIIQLDGQPVRAPDTIDRAIAGMRAGDRVEVRYVQGPFEYVTEVTLEAKPAAQP